MGKTPQNNHKIQSTLMKLPGVTQGKCQMMNIWSLGTFVQSKWEKHLKICLKIQYSLLSSNQNVVAMKNQM